MTAVILEGNTQVGFPFELGTSRATTLIIAPFYFSPLTSYLLPLTSHLSPLTSHLSPTPDVPALRSHTPFSSRRLKKSSIDLRVASRSGTSGLLANWAIFPSTGRY